MTFEAFDLAPLIESGRFTPDMAAVPEAGAPTLDAALREAARAERADAILLDLWLDRPGRANWRAGASAHALAAAEDGGGVLDLGGGKQTPLSAAFGPEGEGEGEKDEDDIIVKGTKPKSTDDESGGGTSGSGGGGGQEGSGEGSGDGGGEPEEGQNDCRDRKAIEAQTAIKNEPDDDYREHGILLYRGADGQVHKSDVLEGNERNIPREVIVDWMTRNGVSFSQVIGFVHNHDAWFYASTDVAAAVNRYPSSADWVDADWFVSNGAGGPGGENFAMYVIDTDHEMREFEYDDRSFYQSLDQDDKIAKTGLPEETTSDGSTCG